MSLHGQILQGVYSFLDFTREKWLLDLLECFWVCSLGVVTMPFNVFVEVQVSTVKHHHPQVLTALINWASNRSQVSAGVCVTSQQLGRDSWCTELLQHQLSSAADGGTLSQWPQARCIFFLLHPGFCCSPKGSKMCRRAPSLLLVWATCSSPNYFLCGEMKM